MNYERLEMALLNGKEGKIFFQLPAYHLLHWLQLAFSLSLCHMVEYKYFSFFYESILPH